MSTPMSDWFSVRDRSILVTGGGGGLGRMISAAFLGAGARVTITGRKAAALDSAAEALAPLGPIETLCGDLREPVAAAELARAYRATGRPLDVLINNAGRTWGEPLATFPHSAWTDVMGVNVTAPFVLVQELLPLLTAGASASRPACVINIGSVYAHLTDVMHSYSYAASKAAIHQLTRVLARELAPRHVLVNAIAPGLFHTRMTDFVFSNEAPRARALAGIPLGRAGAAEDIGGLTVFLASRAGAYLTGTVLTLDGGMSLSQ